MNFRSINSSSLLSFFCAKIQTLFARKWIFMVIFWVLVQKLKSEKKCRFSNSVDCSISLLEFAEQPTERLCSSTQLRALSARTNSQTKCTLCCSDGQNKIVMVRGFNCNQAKDVSGSLQNNVAEGSRWVFLQCYIFFGSWRMKDLGLMLEVLTLHNINLYKVIVWRIF